MATATLKVTGMTCGHCAQAVTQALQSQDGVSAAQVDLAKGSARVEYDPSQVTMAQLAAAVAEEGYEAEEVT